MAKLFVINAFLIIHFCIFAQSRTITGRVTDTDLQPIWDVQILNNNDTLNIQYTDLGGFYSIVINDSTSTLSFSKSGFQNKTVKINDLSEVNLVLDIATVYEMTFEDLLQTKVTTVSLKEQNINEAPGIVSILTREDLKQMGVRTVREALTYIAGFAPLQNDDEQILVVRGIFATTNQKILVMRDGHSLNEANLDIPQSDYSISIENIKKIEVIRGPGASIYGNSALAAVVNIITDNSNETRIKAGVGNFGQYNIDVYSGVKLDDKKDLVVFGRYASTEGEPYEVTVNDYKKSPLYKAKYKTFNYPSNYDVGFNYKTPLYTTSLAVRKHIYKTYWTGNGSYTNVDSLPVEPRLLQNSVHYDLTFRPEISRNLKLILQNYADYTQLNNYRALASLDTVQLSEWNVKKFGLNYYLSWAYLNNGQLLAGITYERRDYLESWFAHNKSTPSITFDNKPFFPEGSENRGAAFIQAQYNITDWLKTDIGARYDIAQLFKSSFNPRIAIIAYPTQKIIVKTIYTSAFQAPGYSYRTSNAFLSGSISALQPERLTTYQASVRYEHQNTAFVELAGYYNQLSNLITRTDKNFYANHGKVATYGLECEARYNTPLFTFFADYAFLLPHISATDSIFKMKNIKDTEFRHFPKHSANFGSNIHISKYVDWSVFTQYYSNFYSLKDIEVNRRVIVNTTLNVLKLLDNFEFNVSVYNLFDLKYKLGDPSVVPIEQPGRWYIFSVILKIDNK